MDGSGYAWKSGDSTTQLFGSICVGFMVFLVAITLNGLVMYYMYTVVKTKKGNLVITMVTVVVIVLIYATDLLMLVFNWHGNILNIDNYISGLKIATMVTPVAIIVIGAVIGLCIFSLKFNQIFLCVTITSLAIIYFSFSIVPMAFNIFIYPVETTVIISYIAATICVIYIMKDHCCHNKKYTSLISYGLVIFILFSITFVYLFVNLLRNSQNFAINFVLAFVPPVSILAYQVWKKSGDKKSERNSEELKEVVTCKEKPQEQKGKSTQNQ